jgi:hypothetical protein
MRNSHVPIRELEGGGVCRLPSTIPANKTTAHCTGWQLKKIRPQATDLFFQSGLHVW